MPYWLSSLLQFSILIAVIIAYMKRRHIHNQYWPFVISIWFNLCGCVASQVANFYFGGNAVTSNIYFIIFCLLVLWQFQRWGLFSDVSKGFYLALAAFIVIWFVDTFIVGSLSAFNPYSRIINSMIIVLFSIQLLSSELLTSETSFWKNSRQLILVAYILLFTIKIITEIFWQFGWQLGDSFVFNIYISYQLINFVVNLLYVIATQWIPTNTRYSWLSR
jgi:hypothetical protein